MSPCAPGPANAARSTWRASRCCNVRNRPFSTPSSTGHARPFLRGELAPNLVVVDEAQLEALREQLRWTGLEISAEPASSRAGRQQFVTTVKYSDRVVLRATSFTAGAGIITRCCASCGRIGAGHGRGVGGFMKSPKELQTHSDSSAVSRCNWGIKPWSHLLQPLRQPYLDNRLTCHAHPARALSGRAIRSSKRKLNITFVLRTVLGLWYWRCRVHQ